MPDIDPIKYLIDSDAFISDEEIGRVNNCLDRIKRLKPWLMPSEQVLMDGIGQHRITRSDAIKIHRIAGRIKCTEQNE